MSYFIPKVCSKDTTLRTSSIDTLGVVQRVLALFRGHSELIGGFNAFLPPRYCIEISSDPRQDIIIVTTPMGVLTQASDGSIGRVPQNYARVCTLPVWKRLISDALPPPEVISVISEMFTSVDEVKMVCNLQGDAAQVFVNAIHEVCFVSFLS